MTTKTVNVEAKTVTFTHDDKTTAVFELAKCSADMVTRLALHGASQKAGDSYAGAAKETDPLGFAKQAVADTIAQIYSGEWRTSTGGARGPSDLAQAIAQGTGSTVEEATDLLASLGDDEAGDNARKALRNKPKVKAALAAIKARKAIAAAERAAKAADAAEAGAAA